MIEVKAEYGKISLRMRGRVDEISADVTQMLHAIHENLRTDADKEFFRHSLEQDVGKEGLAWMNEEQFNEKFKEVIRGALREIFGSDCQKAETDAEKPQAKPCDCDPELAKLFADIRAAEEIFRGRRGQTDESRS